MRNRIPDEVTCAICGRHFDPSESRGWCPNPSCGEWQHPSFPIEGESGGSDSSGGATLTKSCPNCGKEVNADTNFCTHCATQFDDDEAVVEEEEDDDELSECPDCGADLSQIPSDQLSKCPICMFDLSPIAKKAGGGDSSDDEEDDTSGGGDELDNCPNCGEDLTPIPSDMRTVCPGCRVDLDESVEAQAAAGGGASGGTAGSGGAITASSSIDEIEGIGTGYQQRLSGIGISTVGDLVATEPDEISAETGISTRRISDWVDSVPVDPADVRPSQEPSAGHTQDAGRSQPGSQRGGQQGSQPGSQQGSQPGSQAGAGTRSQGRDSYDSGQSQPANQTRGQSGGSDRGTYSAGSSQRDQSSNRHQSTDSTPQPETTDVNTGPNSYGGGNDDMMETQISPSSDETMETKIQPTYKELVLEVMGQEIPVTDGSTVGREVRRAMVEAGRSEEKAVYVHRKHVRIDQEDGDFYLTRLGDNSLKVNGTSVEKGDRIPIGNGDDITFSDVVTASVSIT